MSHAGALVSLSLVGYETRGENLPPRARPSSGLSEDISHTNSQNTVCSWTFADGRRTACSGMDTSDWMKKMTELCEEIGSLQQEKNLNTDRNKTRRRDGKVSRSNR